MLLARALKCAQVLGLWFTLLAPWRKYRLSFVHVYIDGLIGQSVKQITIMRIHVWPRRNLGTSQPMWATRFTKVRAVDHEVGHVDCEIWKRSEASV